MIRFALPVLFEAVLRALLAACILWVGLRLLRVRNVWAQKAAWSVMLIAGIAMPLLMHSHWFPAWAEVKLPVSSWSNFTLRPQTPVKIVNSAALPAQAPASAPKPSPVATATNASPDATGVDFETLPHSASVSQPASTPTPFAPSTTPVAGKTNRFPFDLFTIAWLVYVAVGAALLLRWLIGLASSIRLWLQATPVEAAELCDAESPVATRASIYIFSPVNIGSGIVLPADYAEWSPEKLRAVLAHEGSHVRQRDFYLQLLAGLYTALTWFSPLGWWLKHKLSELSEAISDHAGLEESSSRSAYAQLLLEFAALPRPTLTGVAMARPNNLPHRIDRLLNESSFKQAFSGGRRTLVAALIVPTALVAATTLFRVQAAAAPAQADSSSTVKLPQDQSPSQSAAEGQLTGQSNPVPAQVGDSDSGQAPPAPPAPEAAPSPAAPNPAPEPPPVPPMPPDGAQDLPAMPPIPPVDLQVQVPPLPPLMPFMHGYEGHASCFADGDAYAIVGDPGTETRFCGNTRGEMEAEVEKARGIAHGHFLLFRHDGKYYVVDDPASVLLIENMDKSLHDQNEQMRELGRQLRVAGRQARDEARKAMANIPAPDLSKEMADLNAAVADLNARQGATVSQEQLAQVQREISAIQRSVIEAEVNADMKNFDANFKAEEGKFNEQMSQMGAQLGRTVQGNQQKIQSIIDESLKNGKAKPVN